MNKVLRQEWIESEAGWGQRPDGYSLHLSQEDLDKYVANYWEGMPSAVPAVYSRPAGAPKMVRVSKEIYEKVKKSEFGVAFG